MGCDTNQSATERARERQASSSNSQKSFNTATWIQSSYCCLVSHSCFLKAGSSICSIESLRPSRCSSDMFNNCCILVPPGKQECPKSFGMHLHCTAESVTSFTPDSGEQHFLRKTVHCYGQVQARRGLKPLQKLLWLWWYFPHFRSLCSNVTLVPLYFDHNERLWQKNCDNM